MELTSLTHHVEELVVALRAADFIEKEFHCLNFIHVVKKFSENPNFLKNVGFQEQLFTARTGAVHIDGRVNTLFGETAFQMDSMLPVPLNSS